MAFIEVKDVTIKGISACLPECSQEVIGLPVFTKEEASKFIAGTGIERRRMAKDDTTTADLCFASAEKLLNTLDWKPDEVDCLIFVSQTPDYILPATSCVLQARLNLKQDIVVMDLSLGCSGWIYGLMTISSLMSTGTLKRGLLLTGDTISKTCSVNDKSTYPLFGDAGTATALEFDTSSKGFKFHLGTNGNGAKAIIIPEGGYRKMYSNDSLINTDYESGISRAPLNLVLDGMDVFSFGIRKAPASVKSLCEHFKIDKESVDYYIFHQANLFMNEKIRKKLKIPTEKVPYTLKNYGNTSSATIPLTIVDQLGALSHNKPHNYIACGFGVGLSWGSVWFSTDQLTCPDIIEI